MAAPGLVNFSGLMDDAKCFAFVRQHRWSEGVWCPGCGGSAVMDFVAAQLGIPAAAFTDLRPARPDPPRIGGRTAGHS